jgi:hypothetical protein
MQMVLPDGRYSAKWFQDVLETHHDSMPTVLVYDEHIVITDAKILMRFRKENICVDNVEMHGSNAAVSSIKTWHVACQKLFDTMNFDAPQLHNFGQYVGDDYGKAISNRTCKKCGDKCKQKCPECEARGDHEFDSGYNSYRCECITCAGSGRIQSDHEEWDNTTASICPSCRIVLGGTQQMEIVRTRIDGHDFDRNRLAMISTLSPTAEYQLKPSPVKPDVYLLHFRTEKVDGILVSLTPE